MRALAALLLAFALLPGAAAAEAPVRVELPAAAELAQVSFTLGDVARITGSGEWAEALAGVALGRAPRVGQTRALTRAEIAAQVGRALPELQQRGLWGGSEVVLVRSLGQAAAAAGLVSAAQAELESWLRSRVDAFEVRTATALRDVWVPFGAVEVRARALEGAALRHRMPVMIDVSVDGAHYQTVPVWFAVEAWSEGLVATRPLAANDHLDPTAVAVRRIDLARAGGPVATLADLQQVRVRGDIAAGMPIRRDALERIPAVAAGQPVRVVARAGAVEIVLVGKALSEGEVGQTVEVITREGRGRFKATVVEQGVVVPQGG